MMSNQCLYFNKSPKRNCRIKSKLWVILTGAAKQKNVRCDSLVQGEDRKQQRNEMSGFSETANR